jgi:flagellar hook-basal body complex protein FliE
MIAALPLITSAVGSLFGSSAPAASPAATGAAGDSFSSLLASFSKDTVGAMKTGEQMSISGISGKATTQSVVEAVMSAQEKLQTALAVRDKAVSAFNDVTRMSI